MQSIEAYPLCWPVGYPRTGNNAKQSAKFKTSFAVVRDNIVKELKRLGAKNPILSTNIPVRQDGLPYASYKALKDTGVAVYFTYNGEQRVFCCDKWVNVEDNLQAVFKTINAFRMIPNWGCSDMLNRMFTGFKSLPQTENKNKSWFDILGVGENCSLEGIKAAYRRLAFIHHPDQGGGAAKMQEINAAYELALARFKSPSQY